MVIALAFSALLIEFVAYNFIHPFFAPNLIIILIVCFTFQMGIRYSLAAAIAGGVLKDCFGENLFGFYLVPFIICAYFSVFIRRYLFHLSPKELRLTMIFILVVFNFLLLYLIQLRFNPPNFLSSLKFVLLPQLVSTLIVAEFTITKIKKCVLKFCE